MPNEKIDLAKALEVLVESLIKQRDTDYETWRNPTISYEFRSELNGEINGLNMAIVGINLVREKAGLLKNSGENT